MPYLGCCVAQEPRALGYLENTVAAESSLLFVLVGLRSVLRASDSQPVTKIGCKNYLPKSNILCSPDPSSFENSRGKATLQYRLPFGEGS